MRKIILLVFALVSLAAWSAPGQLDRAFGTDGKLVFAGVGFSFYNMFEAPDGGVILTHATSAVVDVTRRLPDGSVSPSWGNGGTATAYSPYVFQAAAFQGDGKAILLAGDTFVRFMPNGALDPSFGSSGAVRAPGLAADYGSVAPVMGVMPDGRIVAASFPETFYWDGAASGTTAAARLNANGTLDASYGKTGVVKNAFGYTWGGYNDFGRKLRVASDGSVHLVRVTSDGILEWSRLATDGSADSSWGTDGTLSLTLPGHAEQLVFTGDGGLLAVDALDDSLLRVLPQLRIWRIRADGTLDSSFGANGAASLDSDGLYFSVLGMLPDGGLALIAADNDSSLVVRRLAGNGQFDDRFGVNGVLRVPPFPFPETVSTMKLSPQGYLNITTVTMPMSTTSDVAVRRIQIVGDLVEFRNSVLDHYFLTYEGDEARGIDAGIAGPGWSRTGGSFRPGGSTPVCRFYGTPGVGPNSHFFTASADECEAVKHAAGWTYEGLGFYTTPPSNGQCAAGLQPVHRLYNHRAAQNDSNHRFTTDPATIAAMQAQGWVYEGIAFCAKT